MDCTNGMEDGQFGDTSRAYILVSAKYSVNPLVDVRSIGQFRGDSPEPSTRARLDSFSFPVLGGDMVMCEIVDAANIDQKKRMEELLSR